MDHDEEDFRDGYGCRNSDDDGHLRAGRERDYGGRRKEYRAGERNRKAAVGLKALPDSKSVNDDPGLPATPLNLKLLSECI